MRKSLKDRPGLLLVLESLIVFMSVFLALGLDSWRSNAANERLAERALLNFEREIELNHPDMLRSFEHNMKQVQELESGQRKGINLQAATIHNNAWEIAQFSGAINNLDFDIVDKASRIHELQRQYQKTAEEAARIIYEGNFMINKDIDDENLRYASMYLVSWLFVQEKALLESYDEFLGVERDSSFSYEKQGSRK